MKLTHICGSVLLLALFHLSQAQAQTGTFERTLQVSGRVNLNVLSSSGNIAVHTGGKSTVHVLAKIHAHNSAYDFWICWGGPGAAEQISKLEMNPPIEQQGNTITIGKIDDWLTQCPVSIDYDLTVPAQTGLVSRSGSGDESIAGLQFPVSAKTGSGNITVKDIGGDLHLSSGSGNLNAGSVKGALYAHTGSGRIQAAGVSGEIVVTTGSGNVDIEQVAAGNVNVGTGSGTVILRGIQGGLRVKTASGRIHVEGKPVGDWHIGTASGDIELKTAPQLSFNFDGSTLSGNLKMGQPVTVQGFVSRHHLQGKAGDGGVLIEARSLSGNIEID
jgi:DUF4097 and DUF4098 domain-containing protein YvlB